MRVTKLSLHNFKSFQDVTIPFRPFNVVIGANASGKSNLVQAFQFLKDIADHGLENAVSLQGGVEFLRNMEAGPDETVRISIELEYSEEGLPSRYMEGFLASPDCIANPKRTKYTLELKSPSRGYGLEIAHEELCQRIEVVDLAPTDAPEPRGEGNVTISRRKDKVELISDANIESLFDNAFLFLTPRMKIEIGTSIFEKPILSGLARGLASSISGVSIYDLDSRLPKIGMPRTGKADLESDGSNLAIVVKDILRDKEKSRSFHNLVGYLLPHVKRVSVEEFAFNSLMMSFRESYAPDRDIPATFISDGTIGMTAALVAFAFEGNHMTILEEPDRNIHPRLISGVTSLMKDVSRRSQILITTHNPEFVRLAGIENLILLSRDNKGFSKVTRPAESDIVKTFLSDEIGIDDLFVDDFLTIGV